MAEQWKFCIWLGDKLRPRNSFWNEPVAEMGAELAASVSFGAAQTSKHIDWEGL